jgi:hypothetical protein
LIEHHQRGNNGCEDFHISPFTNVCDLATAPDEAPKATLHKLCSQYQRGNGD